MLKKLVQHKTVPAVLARVVREDPEDNRNVIIRTLGENKEFPCPKVSLVVLE